MKLPALALTIALTPFVPVFAFKVAVHADTATPSQPYGGCIEAHAYPLSPGATDCRDLGWTVAKHAVFGPHGYLRWSDLAPCQTDEFDPVIPDCVWDAGRRGDRAGTGFWIHSGNLHLARRSVY